MTNQTPATSISGSYQAGLGQDGSSYGDMRCSQVAMMGHQQYGTDQYVQYSSPVGKIGHAQGMMMGPGGQQPQQQQQQQHMQPQQGTFSPSVVGMMPQQQGGYGGYGMGPHGHNPQPPMSQMSPMISPNSGWNQAQTSPNQPAQLHPHPQFMPGTPQSQMSPYMGQSYHPQQMPQMSQYNPTNQIATSSSPYIHSPNPMQTGLASPPASINMIGQMPPRGPHAGSFPSHQVPASQHNSMLQGGYNPQMGQGLPGVAQYTNDMMSSHGPSQMSSASIGQHYPPYTGNQQSRQDGSVTMSHYTSQNSAQAYCPPYPTIAQPRPSSTTTPSPRPTPPPQSLTPNHSSSSQGSYGQSSLQQLEQLVSPGMGAANPYQQLMQQSSGSPTGNSSMQGQQQQQAPIYSSSSFPTTTVSSTVAMGGSMQSSGMSSGQGHMNMQGQITVQNSSGMASYPGQGQIMLGPPSSGPLSPNQGILTQNSVEIQRLEQQLQQLMNMPQSPQVSQQMLDIQERLRILHSQHQIHMPQQQNSQMHQQNPQMHQHVSQQQQPRLPGGKIRMQQQQIMPQPPQIRALRAGPSSHMQLTQMNGQPMQMQQVYTRSPGLGHDQMTSGLVHGSLSQQSIPSPQKIQPFQVSFCQMCQ